MSWLYIPTVCIRVSISFFFFFFANTLMSSMYINWLIFSCDLLSLYPAVHFLSMWLCGIMAIMNSNSDSASPRKIPLWIFVTAKLFPPVVNSTFQVFMVFLWLHVIFCTFCGSLLSSFAKPYPMPFCCQSSLFPFGLAHVKDVLIYVK